MAVAPGLPQQASAPSAPDSALVPVPVVEELLSASVVSAINERCKVKNNYLIIFFIFFIITNFIIIIDDIN